MARAVFIKGTREGITITLGKGDLDALYAELAEHLERQGAFFRGGLVALDVGEHHLDVQQLASLHDLLSSHTMTLRTVIASDEGTQKAAEELGLRVIVPANDVSPPTLEESAPPRDEHTQAAVRDPIANRLAEREVPSSVSGSRGMVVRQRLRAGQVLRYSGSVLVIGDVNVGAEIVAGGDVVIWGRLRGVVHAGFPHDTTAIVCALDLAPMQLRIGNLIARPEDAPLRRRNIYPEVAYVREGMIVVERWDSAHWED